MSNCVFNSNLSPLVLSEIIGDAILGLFATGCPQCTKSEYFTIANSVFYFSFLAPVVFRDNRGPKFIIGPCAPCTPPSETILTHAQVLVYTYITIKFQLRSSITVRLRESSL